MVRGESSDRRNRVGRVEVWLILFGALTFLWPVLAACGATGAPADALVATTPGVRASPGARSITAVATSSAVDPTTAAPATATVNPTVIAAVPAAEAIGTMAAPTIQAAATALAPTAFAAATMDALSTGTPATTTAGQLATAGKGVYADSCAVCHGDQGQGVVGPALVGPAASFSTFKTAQDLLTFDSAMMPLTSPGSLTRQQYVEVVSWILVENGFVSKDAPMSSSSFGAISLTR